MTAPPPSTSIPAPAPSIPERPELSVRQIEDSCRVPVLVLITAAVAWLGIGAVFGVISAIKAHAPGFLAGVASLTYGRVYPASNLALVYGFVVQAGLGLGLWVLCRLGRNVVQGVSIITGAGILWNIGLLIGIGGVLAGGSTAYPWLEMPGVASPVLFCAYVLMAGWVLVTLHARERRSLYVSQWFILAGLLWFPWVFSTAQVLLIYSPVRGVMQAVVNGWYIHNLFEMSLASVGLAVIFYFVPKLLARPLHSRGLVLFGFWTLAFFVGWGGLQRGDPVPSWMSGISAVGRVFLLVPVLAFGLSWFRTISGGHKQIGADRTLRFILVAMISYLLAAVPETAGALPAINQITAFTLFAQGTSQLRIHGFLAMALAGGCYYVWPRLTGRAWPSLGWIDVHFWCATAGMVLSAAALVIGGVVQGTGIARPDIDFVRVVRSTVPFLGTNTLGMTLLLVGYGAFILNVCRSLAAGCAGSVCWPRARPVPDGVDRRSRA
jgi:cytochrome c oxidase cbb3-type subunit I